ncbi:tyrosine-type recombinase/integrase [Paenibacillus sp. LMG 31456]|uniref:Tyrosine-type recombinase/integrase n=1 Tax=Paenibacillus foliorum TaxID=2654974 RepID=A0A972GW98_9BACL|nr:site-specific integrase [Paenibacillus foliorum]NOU95639.1 tyrosine-type recombinase/integrase [Paenibacillus foliorum]
MASFRKRGKNSWQLVVELGFDEKGDRIQKTKTVRIEDEKLLKTTKRLNEYLEQEVIKFKIEVESGHYISPDKMSFESFVKEWKSKFVLRNLEAKTVENYLFHSQKRIVPYFGHLRINQIKTIQIINYLDSLQHPGSRADRKNGSLGSASVVYNYRVLRSIFSKAVEWKLIKDNPMIGITKPKDVPKEIEVYDDHEVRELFKSLQQEPIQFRILITLALTTGLRRGELLGLEWRHIDIEKGIIEVRQSIPIFKDGQPLIKPPKNKSSTRKISLPLSLVNELIEYQDHMSREQDSIEDRIEVRYHSFLFCNTSGLPYYPKTIGDQWRSFHKRNPHLKYIRFHDLRHTSATLLINQGVHAKIISSRLGHSNISTTMNVYGHVIQSADQAAADTFDTYFNNNKKDF